MVKERTNKIFDNMEKVIVGKREVMEYVLAAFLAGGHILLEDVPGTGKTMLSKALAASFGMEFRRVQFTPDLLPADVTGIHYFNPKTSEFEFRPGAIFGNIILADEVNRATPRTQSSLLECMEERQATIDGTTMKVGDPFFVIATQNPIESSGTFPLPEAQLDRFAMQLSMGYPEENDEKDLLSRALDGKLEPEQLSAVCSKESFLEMQQACEKVLVHDTIRDYVLALAKATREQNNIAMGVSSRGAIMLLKVARCYAAIQGLEYVTVGYIKKLAPYVWSHRIVLDDPYFTNKTTRDYILEILGAVPAPTEESF